MKKKEEIEILEEYEIVEEEKKSTPIYIGYTPRLVISIILLPIFSMIAVFLLYKAFQVKDIINVRYSERSTPTFQVFGEDSNTLSPAEDGRWNQTDINKVLLETSYDFQTNTETTMNFTYQMMADLIILEKDNPDKVFCQKNIEVSEPKKEVMEGKAIIIKDQASIDYQEYNEIASKYKEGYGVETDSFINFYLKVSYKSSPKENFILEGTETPGLRISLQQERVDLEVEEIDTDKRINKKPEIQLVSPGFLGLGILSGLCGVFALSQIILLVTATMDERTIYDKTVEDFLKKQKGNIEVIKKAIPKKKRTIIRVNTFKELLKAQKKTKQKIFYHVINEHHKCEFYVVNDTEMFILTIKEVDLEKEKD